MTSVATSRSVDWETVLRLIPGYDPFATAGECRFDEEAADQVVGFFSDCLVHVKGEWAGHKIVLAPWQQAVVGNLFGWKRPDGTRRFREALIFVPRKNGKTVLASGLALYAFFCDGEPGSEIYCAAADREQAKLLWDVSRRQILAEPTLAQACKLYQHSIVIDSMGSSFKAISADAHTKHGYNSHFVVVDELHAQPTSELVDVLLTSTGARRQPLIVYLTTSDFERPSVCNEKHEYASKVRDRVIDDPSFLPVIYEASRDDDWTDPDVWARVNPNLGVSLSREYLERECRRAKEQASYVNTFKRLHLNVKTEADVAWLSMEQWDACDGAVDLEALRGRPCFAGLDLASVSDLTAFVLLFPEDDNAVLPFFWVPRATALKRQDKAIQPCYMTWSQQGCMELTPGNVCDYDCVRAKINELGELYDIRGIAFDRWGATQLSTQLEGDGFDMVSFGQGYASLSAPSKETEKLVIGGQFHHGGHPVLRWNAANAMLETDAAGNIKPSKKKSTDKIDGIVALVMALGLAIEAEEPVAWDPEVWVI
jgi:phage terminase large subunit-like protein